MIYLYYSDSFMGYNFGPEHPMQPARLMLTSRLIDEYGFLLDYNAARAEPYHAREDELTMVHSQDYVDAVKAEEPDPRFGLDDMDNPVFPGIFDAARVIAGGSLEAARKVVSEDCTAFNIGGGLHHAMPSKASGFCIFNDAALAIRLLRQKVSRVLYLDIDCHHGDGVQTIFYDDPTVLTISLHQSGKSIFPGTGFVDEVGVGDGRGYSVNVPLPAETGDSAYIDAFEKVVPGLFRWFCPDVVVAQLGVDAHYADPITHLNLTLNAYDHLFHRIRDLAQTYCEGRLVALGGGGYNMEVVPLAWSMAFQILKGDDMPIDTPTWWESSIKKIVGRPPLSLPDPGPGVQLSPEKGRLIADEVSSTVLGLKKLLRDIHEPMLDNW